jgi:hypothetical protein
MDADWLDELLSDTREVVQGLLDEPTVAGEALTGAVRAYREHLADLAKPMTDVELGMKLADANLDLLAAVADGPSEARRLAQVAARYLVLFVEEDLGSPFGFDDDLEVFNVVAARLGRPELQVQD